MAKADKSTSVLNALVDDSSLVRTVAVIDVGSASIRMEIAQIDSAGKVHPLESLRQTVDLGKDSFTRGEIRQRTVEQCVEVLQTFKRVLLEYGITAPEQIRAVATTAVREAVNRNEFVDRIYIATEIELKVIDDAEVNRLTYMAIEPLLKSKSELSKHATLVVEVGGGSTELLLLQNGVMTHSGGYRLGSQRMMEMLDAYRAPIVHKRSIMESQIQLAMDQIVQSVPLKDEPLNLLVMGGDARFVVSELDPEWNRASPAVLKTSKLKEFTEGVLEQSVDELVQRYHMTFLDAESLGPALLTLERMAYTFGLKKMYVVPTTLRQGLLSELAGRDAWTNEFSGQVLQAALDLGRKFHFDEAHGTHVAGLSLQLFDQLQDLHQMDARHRLLLHLGAKLHEIGLVVSTRSHHKHSMYLIINSELFGLGNADRQKVALVARYHRRATPKLSHDLYSSLERSDRIAVSKMSALLRVADSLDRRHDQHIGGITCVQEEKSLIIRVPNVDDLTLESVALQQKGSLFEQVFGLEVELRALRKGDDNGTRN